MRHKRWTLLDIATVFAAVVVIAAAFMPWAKASVGAFGFSVSTEVDGTDSDGLLTLLLAVCLIIAVLAAIYAGAPGRPAALVAAAFGLAIVVIGVLAWLDVEELIDVDNTNLEDLPGVEVKAQLGLYVTIAAGAVATLLALIGAAQGQAPGNRAD